VIPIRSTEQPRSRSVVTGLIIALNVLVFLYELTRSPVGREVLIVHYGMIADRIHWETLVTSMFLHSGWWHLIGNMWFLWIYGRNIEDLFGHLKFLFFYLACGIVAGLIQMAVDPHSTIPTIGASGAIAGVMGAYLNKLPHSRIITLVIPVIFVFTLELPAAFPLIYWFVIQFFNGVGSLESRQMTAHIAWFAHIGGFTAGWLMALMIKSRTRYIFQPSIQ
jgi:membrane associated rhomboid family serine protease